MVAHRVRRPLRRLAAPRAQCSACCLRVCAAAVQDASCAQAFSSRLTLTGCGVRSSCANRLTRSSSSSQRNSSSRASAHALALGQVAPGSAARAGAARPGAARRAPDRRAACRAASRSPSGSAAGAPAAPTASSATKRLRHQARELRRDVVGDLLRRRARPSACAARRRARQDRAARCARPRSRSASAAPRPSSRRRANAAASVGSGSARKARSSATSTICSRSSSALPQRHVGDRHLLQVGDVLLEVLERVRDLQRDQAPQAGAVLARGDIGLVEHLDLDVRAACRSAPESRPATGRRLRISISSGSSPKVQAVYCGAAGAVALARRARRPAPRAVPRDRAAACAPLAGAAGRARSATRRQLQRRQRLERRARLAAELGLQRGQVAPHAELAAMLVDDPEVHQQVRRQLLELEVGALDVELGLARARLRAARRPGCPRRTSRRRRRRPAAYSGSGTSRERSRCGSVFSSTSTFSFSMPGTSHSQRSSLTWFSA